MVQADHLSAKVTLAWYAQYASEYVRDFLTLEGSKNIRCIDTHSDSWNCPLQYLLREIMVLPSILACILDGDKPHILLYVRVDHLFFLFTGDFYQQG